MNVFDGFRTSFLVESLGWTLFHSLWQVTLLFVLHAALRAALRRGSPQARYAAGAVTLAAALVVPVCTFVHVASSQREPGVSGGSAVSVDASRAEPARPLLGNLPDLADSAAASAAVAMPSSGTKATAPQETSAIAAIWRRITDTARPTLPWGVSAWLAGVVLLGLWNLMAWIGTQRLRSAGATAAPADVLAAFQRLVERMGVSRRVRLVQSTAIAAPITLGWIRPLILLPAAALSRVPVTHLEAVIAHELAHVRRHDYLVNLVQRAVETALFFHPLVWWLSRSVRRDREECCDDVAVAVSGDPALYAASLAAFEEVRAGCPSLALAAAGDLLTRVRRILAPGARSSGLRGAWVAPALVLAAAAALSLANASHVSGGVEPAALEEVDGDKVDGAPLTVTLESGTKVELVGVSTNPSSKNSWWRPDGRPLSVAPYATMGGRVEASEEVSGYELAISIGETRDASWRWSVPGGRASTDTGAPRDESGRSIESLRAMAVSVPRSVLSTTVRFGIAVGEWSVRVSHGVDDAKSYQLDDGGVIFQAVDAIDGQAVVSIAHTFLEPVVRLSALDVDGTRREAVNITGDSLTGFCSLRYRFPIAAERLSRLEFATRELEWIEFRDVSLERDVVTRPRAALVALGALPSGEGREVPSVGASRELRLHEVGLLLRERPDFPAPELGVQSPATPQVDVEPPEVADRAREARRAELARELGDLVRSVIEPGTWDGENRIEAAGSQLVVLAPAAVQRQIEDLLAMLKEDAQRVVTVEARLLEIDEKRLEAASGGLAERLRDALAGLGQRRFLDLTDAEAKELLGSSGDAPPGSEGGFRVTAFNRQLAHLAVIEQAAIAAGFEESDDGDEKRPVIKVLNTGHVLQVRPAVSGRDESLALDLELEFHNVSVRKPIETVVVDGLPVQVPELFRRSLQCALTVRPGRWFLLGGLRMQDPKRWTLVVARARLDAADGE